MIACLSHPYHRDVAIPSGCKHLLLTHFSQRYAKFPEIAIPHAERFTACGGVLFVAFDMLRVPLFPVFEATPGLPPITTNFFETGRVIAGLSVELPQSNLFDV